MPEVTVASIPTPPDIPRDDDIAGFVATLGTLETEDVPYRASVIAGTKEIPAEVADAMEALLDGAVERRGKQEIYTMYDSFGIPSRVDGLRIQMMLREKDPVTGKPIFYARPPKNLPRQILIAVNGTSVVDTALVDELIASKEPVFVGGECDGCGKAIMEFPHMVRPRPLTDHDSTWWRVQMLKFPHLWLRHSMLVPQIYRDHGLRDALAQASAQARR